MKEPLDPAAFRLLVLVKDYDNINAQDLRDTYYLGPVVPITYSALFEIMYRLWNVELIKIDAATVERMRSDAYVLNQTGAFQADTCFGTTPKATLAIFDTREFYRELAQFRNG